MSFQVYFISDLHLGHRRVIEFSENFRQGSTIEEHDEWLRDCWCSTVKKQRDIIYVLGDIAFSRSALALFGKLPGDKRLILGNHDKFPITEYLEHGKVLPGLLRYKEFWLSHAPIHPNELRNKVNVHGHVHEKTLPDCRYINVSVEVVNGFPISLDQLRGLYAPNS